MFRRLYNWTRRLAAHRHAVRSMALVSFAESSFFPIPPDVVLVPIILMQREKAYWIAFVCTIASVLGGVLGYAIGYFLYDTVGKWLLAVYQLEHVGAEFQHWYADWGLAVILIKGLTPIPYKVVTIASGLAKFDFAIFVAASLVTRGARFFAIAFLLRRYGAGIERLIDKRLNEIAWIMLALLIGGFAVLALR